MAQINNNQKNIVEMFDKIAKTYDVANRILSLGIDTIWRKKACNIAFSFYGKTKIDKIVDVACGTGDLMIDWETVGASNAISISQIIGVDPSVGMMEVGKDKIPHRTFVEGSAELLPMDNNSVDFVSISYGIRNVVKRKEALSQFSRVLKKDGLCVILEFTKNEKDNFGAKISKFYLNNIMPIIGGFISSNKDAYMYLPQSIENFITTRQLCDELKIAKLEPIFVKSYSLNMSTTIIARKI
ncbi:Ubiquinone/menaquinone biosynthesis methyltransferase UbiE [hydrothermal vent metagenome]|uniref:Ubiquinone/menaquinone biosynthesis methyltransferase UbiE n=1 Tax=hydrothermal vent metagenome TaxID=652676 RepID=A0A3B1EA11_9ZZZZ